MKKILSTSTEYQADVIRTYYDGLHGVRTTYCNQSYWRLVPMTTDNIWQEFVLLSVLSGGSANASRTGMHEKDTLY